MMESGIYLLRLAQSSSDKKFEGWFDLKENLFKVGGSLKRLRQAEKLLWHGLVEAVKDLLSRECPKRARKFLSYLDKHRSRLVNYHLLQTEYMVSIGSGAVESAIKQIDRRLKLSGAQWQPSNVNRMLQLRCAYLNGQLLI